MDAIENIFNIDWKTVVLGIVAGLLAFKAIIELLKWFLFDFLGIETKAMRQKREEHELLIQTSQSLTVLQEKQTEDVKQSIRHDEMIRNDLSNLFGTIFQIKDEVTLMRTQRDNDKLAEYKDKVGQSYRYYHARSYSEEEPVPYWNHMEKESLEGLIRQYESHGGSNSFVHSVVEPEMQTWKVID